MISHVTESFRKTLEALPERVRADARDAFKLFLKDPYHTSLRFKQVSSSKSIVSVRVGRNYRALGVRKDDVVIWYWIGSHSEYDKLISQF